MSRLAAERSPWGRGNKSCLLIGQRILVVVGLTVGMRQQVIWVKTTSWPDGVRGRDDVWKSEDRIIMKASQKTLPVDNEVRRLCLFASRVAEVRPFCLASSSGLVWRRGQERRGREAGQTRPREADGYQRGRRVPERLRRRVSERQIGAHRRRSSSDPGPALIQIQL
ncbi:unnamed protein product [Arctogadus glacialis]